MEKIFHTESQEEFQRALRDVLNNFNVISNVTQMTKDSTTIKAAKDDIKKLLSDSDYDTNQISELLVCKGWDREKIAFFVNLLNEKKTELLYATLINQNSEYGEMVTGFDWLLNIVLGTSEINTLKYPLFQLILSTNSNGIQKKLLYDINKDMLLKLIDTLETYYHAYEK